VLLVVRTNASNDRYWEARRLWGSIINECRNLVRAGRVFLPTESELVATIAVRTAALCLAVMNVLRGVARYGRPSYAPSRHAMFADLAVRPAPLAVATSIS
jgi:predicted membrane chloride channel (bestrophin family)